MFFYFSRNQKIGIIILCFIIGVIFIIGKIMPVKDYSGLYSEEAGDKQVVVPVNSLHEELQTSFFDFNPNTLDSLGFIRLGLPPRTVANILKYRAKGGYFKNPADFSKIYALEPALFELLKPYISIPQGKIIAIELNSCDTIGLQQLNGIGPVFARRIVKYRNLLGGFHSKEQLLEVYGLTADKYRQIEKQVTVDNKHIRKIAVNTATINQLKSHPYLNSQQATAIISFRESKPLTADDLQSVLPDETYSKIRPYLSLENQN